MKLFDACKRFRSPELDEPCTECKTRVAVFHVDIDERRLELCAECLALEEARHPAEPVRWIP